jgi:UDP-glucuronate decarboxylase
VTSLVAGGAGFLGSHLSESLVRDGDEVIIIDNLSTGHVRNLERTLSSGRATFVHADVSRPYPELAQLVARATKRKIDRIYHLASPASPDAYMAEPWATLAVNGLGTMSLVELALAQDARFLYASTSEIYGDPLVHPQPESYFGNVDSIGPRSCYDEGKRFGEAVVATGVRDRGLDGRLVRFFNCYGPSMGEADGRLIPQLVDAIRKKQPLPIHGTGKQTRSMTYVSDAIELTKLVMEQPQVTLQPINVGNDDERSVEDIARALALAAGIEFNPVYLPGREQDPQRRCPDLTLARRIGWAPSTSLEAGLRETYRWFCEDRLAFA